MRILFISSTRVGDAILSTGLLQHLLQQHPGARVTVACGPAAASLFEAVPGLEKIIVLDKMVFSFHWLRLWSACAGKVWDVLVDLRNSPMYYILFSRNRWRIGKGRSGLHRVRQLAEVMDLQDDPPAPYLWLSEKQKKKSLELIPDGVPVLAVGPTANWRAKTWRVECFVELIERLTDVNGMLPGGRVAIFGRDDERPMALRLIDAIPENRRIDLVGKLDLLDAYACLKRCAFYVGNDSGLMHLAAASGIPTLGLFGPSPEELYAPWGELSAVASTSVPYSEIFPKDFDHKASGTLMDSLTVDEAQSKAMKLWEQAEKAGVSG